MGTNTSHDEDQASGERGVDLELLARGSTIGRYTVLERLGAGAMGVVYAAYDPELDRKIALKLLRSQRSEGDQARRQARMVREAKAIAKISHPNVVGIFDVGVHQGQVFMAMEHLAGGTLRDWLAAKTRPWRDVVKVFIEIGRGLAGAHGEGLVHRDFKPDNVLIDKNAVPKVVDFGLVRLSQSTADLIGSGGVAIGDSEADWEVDSVEARVAPALRGAADTAALTRTGALTGTPAYMAPEQFRGEQVDARTDQFAFCVALYEALYGERPFAGENLIALAHSVITGRIQPAPKNSPVPGWVRSCLLRGLKANPLERYPDFEQVLAVLSNDPARRTRKWAIVGVALAAALGAVGVAHRAGSNQRTMCTGARSRLAGIWAPGPGGAERRETIHRVFAASGKSYAEQAYTGVAHLLDQYLARWTTMYTDACEATHVRGEQSAEVLDLRMACLSERLGNARALSDVLAAADSKVVENAVSATAALPSLDQCADVALLRAVVKPPEDASTRKRVEDLRAQLAQLIALRDSGQCALALPRAGALIEEARAVGYQPLLASTLYEAAQAGNNCGEVAEAVQRFKEAHVVASASRSDEVAAQAAALIPSFAINRLAEVPVAQEWLLVARGAVGRLGRETLAHAMLAQAEGMVALSERAYDRALAAADHSIEITRRLLGPDDPLTIQWESNKTGFQQTAGRLDEALQTAVAAREHFERVLGPGHPRVALVSNNEGEVLNLLQRYGEAEIAYERSVRLFRESGGNADVLGWALTGLGQARLGQKRPASAVPPLEEGLALRLDRPTTPDLLGETRFALARALRSSPVERRRALALAASARADYRDDQKMVGEIDGWMAGARAAELATGPTMDRQQGE
jgi:tetratricopeptide (TPR) repeat protein